MKRGLKRSNLRDLMGQEIAPAPAVRAPMKRGLKHLIWLPCRDGKCPAVRAPMKRGLKHEAQGGDGAASGRPAVRAPMKRGLKHQAPGLQPCGPGRPAVRAPMKRGLKPT